MTNQNFGVGQAQPTLTEAVRKKMVDDLAEEHAAGVAVLTFVIAAVLLSFFLEPALLPVLIRKFGESKWYGWLVVWFPTGIASAVAYSARENIQKASLEKHDGQMLQLLYTEYQGKQQAAKVFWSIIVGAVIVVLLLVYSKKGVSGAQREHNFSAKEAEFKEIMTNSSLDRKINARSRHFRH